MMALSPITQAIEEIRIGKIIVLVDDENRENEGDLVMAAQKVTPEAVTFMAMHGRGLICLTLEAEKVDQLKIPMMPVHNHTLFGAAFTVSVEAKEGVTTGISAYDRAHTIKTLIADNAGTQDWVSPGHLFPLRAHPGGVLERNGHTEASVNLARLAGLNPSAVICEIMKDDGTMARLPDLHEFAHHHKLGLYSIEQLVDYMRAQRQMGVNAPEGNLTQCAYC
jgi:3,4-dihydroxy 2-butanone 4-phosphate synthase/GTP cyclohydrolase II